MAQRVIRFGVIGCGLMGREFASAAARWLHLDTGDPGPAGRPEIVAVCDPSPAAAQWFADRVPTVKTVTADHRALLASDVDAVYVAVPHNLHAGIYGDVLAAGKHMLGEKPFGIDKPANDAINAAVAKAKGLVRCSSEIPFFPGAYQLAKLVREGWLGRIIEVEAGFWHSSDLNPLKPINWKRKVEFCGEYGCMGDLGMHVVHLPLRFGWRPSNVRALLSKVVAERPDGRGGMAACETWDNATLATEVKTPADHFPMVLSMKRVAPGHNNTWFVRVWGTEMSVEFSTKNPKVLRTLPYKPGGPQAWHEEDAAHVSAYPSITGGIFEFGFSDSILQMWAAFCDEVVRGPEMKQPLRCATPEEARQSHGLFTAALESHKAGSTVAVAL